MVPQIQNKDSVDEVDTKWQRTCESDGRRKEPLQDNANGPFDGESGHQDVPEKEHLHDNIQTTEEGTSMNNLLGRLDDMSQPSTLNSMKLVQDLIR